MFFAKGHEKGGGQPWRQSPNRWSKGAWFGTAILYCASDEGSYALSGEYEISDEESESALAPHFEACRKSTPFTNFLVLSADMMVCIISFSAVGL